MYVWVLTRIGEGWDEPEIALFQHKRSAQRAASGRYDISASDWTRVRRNKHCLWSEDQSSYPVGLQRIRVVQT